MKRHDTSQFPWGHRILDLIDSSGVERVENTGHPSSSGAWIPLFLGLGLGLDLQPQMAR